LKLLFLGDIVGRTGRRVLAQQLHRLVDRHAVDFVVANGENAAAGFGLTAEILNELLDLGIDVITTGNHIWDKREIYSALEREARLLRPDNYPPGVPGRGAGLFYTCAGIPVRVINLEGRVFMNALDCPFRKTDSLLDEQAADFDCKITFVDFHAETTSEKNAFAHYVDGRVSAVAGTHTHIQTADERVLPGGTGFITDVGMTGSRNGVLGMKKENSIERFLTQMKGRYEVSKKEPMICGVLFDIDETTGRCVSVERIQLVVEN